MEPFDLLDMGEVDLELGDLGDLGDRSLCKELRLPKRCTRPSSLKPDRKRSKARKGSVLGGAPGLPTSMPSRSAARRSVAKTWEDERIVALGSQEHGLAKLGGHCGTPTVTTY